MIKKLVTLILISGLVTGTTLFAEEIFSANDLTPAALTAPAAFGNFTITATVEKGASIDPMDPARTAEDGEIFNARIKLGGAGSAEFRSIKFSVKGKTEITVYGLSSSKTDARVVNLVSAKDGTVLAELPVPADTGTNVGIAKATIAAAGDYYITSKSSGIYVYQVVLK